MEKHLFGKMSEFRILRYLKTALRMIIQFNAEEVRYQKLLLEKNPKYFPTVSSHSVGTCQHFVRDPQPLLKTQLKPLILHLGMMETDSVCSLPLGLILEPIHSLCCQPLEQPGGCVATEPFVSPILLGEH